MTDQEILEQIQSGELPPAGIIRRTGAAQFIKVTTVIDGEVVEVPDVDLSALPTDEAPEEAGEEQS